MATGPKDEPWSDRRRFWLAAGAGALSALVILAITLAVFHAEVRRLVDEQTSLPCARNECIPLDPTQKVRAPDGTLVLVSDAEEALYNVTIGRWFQGLQLILIGGIVLAWTALCVAAWLIARERILRVLLILFVPFAVAAALVYQSGSSRYHCQLAGEHGFFSGSSSDDEHFPFVGRNAGPVGRSYGTYDELGLDLGVPLLHTHGCYSET